MTQFRLDVHRETERAMLFMETGCGFRPVIGWSNLNGLKDFAEMLLDIYYHRIREKDRIREVSESIIRQALGEGLNPLEEEPRAE